MYSFRKKIDQKLINSFLKLNNFKIENLNNGKKILLVDRNLPETTLLDSYFTYILNKKYKFDIFLLTSQSEKNQLNQIYKSFNLKNIFNINIKKNIYSLDLIIKSLIYFIPSFFIVLFNSRKKFIENFKINQVHFGDVIYDHFIRQDNQYDKKSLFCYKFLKLILITLYKFFYIKKLIIKNKFDFIISHTHTYASNSAIAMRIALKNNIKVINILSSRIRIYNKLSQSYRSELFLDLNNVKNIKKVDKKWKSKIDTYLDKRFKGKIKHHNTLDAYAKKNTNVKKFFSRKKYKKVILFAPHAFADANHAFGKLIFDSYYHQFLETLKIAEKTKDYLWIIKNHPTNYKFKSKRYKLGEEEIVINQLKNFQQKNIIYCPSNLSTKTLIDFSDLVITGRGSIGLESAILGKKPLLCGENFYSKLGFTINAKNINHYKKIILNPKTNYKLNKSKIFLAKKAFYIFAFKNSYLKEDMIERNNYIHIDSKKKITQKFFSIEEYLKRFLNTLKIYKNKIIRDKIFKHFENEFEKLLKKT